MHKAACLAAKAAAAALPLPAFTATLTLGGRVLVTQVLTPRIDGSIKSASTVASTGTVKSQVFDGGAPAACEAALSNLIACWAVLLEQPHRGQLLATLRTAEGRVAVPAAPTIDPVEVYIREKWGLP